MKRITFIMTPFPLFAAVVFADTPEEHQDCPAPMSVTGNHKHAIGEMMFSYRFMAMDMQGLQSGTESIEQQTFSKTL